MKPFTYHAGTSHTQCEFRLYTDTIRNKKEHFTFRSLTPHIMTETHVKINQVIWVPTFINNK